jgi:hypothetical protein
MPNGFFLKKKPPFSALKGEQELENRSIQPMLAACLGESSICMRE